MKTEWMNRRKYQFRQLSAAALTVSVTLILLGAPTAAQAQKATESIAPFIASPAQGPEGSWLYTVTLPGYTFQGIETYSDGGGYTEADQLSFNPIAVASAGHGGWKMTSARTFDLTYLNLTFDSFTGGNATGTLKVRQTTTIGKGGNSYTGSGDYTYYDLAGNAYLSGTFTITASRILVEAPK